MKILKLAAVITLVITLISLLINLFGLFGNESILNAIRDDAGLAKIGAVIVLGFFAVKFIIGLIGLVGRGRKLCMICGLVLIVLSIPTDFSNTAMLIWRLICLAVAVMYFIGAFALPRYGTAEGPADTIEAEKVEPVKKPASEESGETAQKEESE